MGTSEPVKGKAEAEDFLGAAAELFGKGAIFSWHRQV
jgi:hypothetical protein